MVAHFDGVRSCERWELEVEGGTNRMPPSTSRHAKRASMNSELDVLEIRRKWVFYIGEV